MKTSVKILFTLFCLTSPLTFPLTATAQYRTDQTVLSNDDHAIGTVGHDRTGLSRTEQPGLSHQEQIELSNPDRIELSNPDRIELSHGEFYDRNGVWLDEAQVRSLFGDDIYQETFVGARKQYRAGRNLLTGGLVAVGAGLACTLVFYSNAHGLEYYDEPDPLGDEPQPLGLMEDSDPSIAAGVVFGILTMVAGGIAIDTGIPLMIIGTRRLAWMEDEYNSRPKYAWSLSFRQTRNGAGLVLSF